MQNNNLEKNIEKYTPYVISLNEKTSRLHEIYSEMVIDLQNKINNDDIRSLCEISDDEKMITSLLKDIRTISREMLIEAERQRDEINRLEHGKTNSLIKSIHNLFEKIFNK